MKFTKEKMEEINKIYFDSTDRRRMGLHLEHGYTARGKVSLLINGSSTTVCELEELNDFIDNLILFRHAILESTGLILTRQSIESDRNTKSFINDCEKMADFITLSKEEFLESYSYLTEEEYEATREEFLELKVGQGNCKWQPTVLPEKGEWND